MLVELIIVEDDNFVMCMLLEWWQVIYEEKFVQVCEVIIVDNNIQILCCFFDVDLDEESICFI